MLFTIVGVFWFFAGKDEENDLKKQKLKLEIENKRIELEILKQIENGNKI